MPGETITPVNQTPPDRPWQLGVEDFIENAETGLAKGAGDIVPGARLVTGLLSGEKSLMQTGKDAFFALLHQTPIGRVMDADKRMQQAMPILHSFYTSLKNNTPVGQALSDANETAKKHDAVLQTFNERAAEFKKNPTQETVRAVIDVLPFVAAAYAGVPETGGAEVGAAEGAEEGLGAEDASTANADEFAPPTADAAPPLEKPSLLKQIIQGKDSVAPQAPGVLRSGLESTGEMGTGVTSPRNMLDDQITMNRAVADKFYKQVDAATGGQT